MQNVIQVSKIRKMIIGFLSVLAVALLFSCTKNAAEVSQPTAEEATSANASSNSANENTIHAVPFEITIFVPCANGGAGEDVTLTGFTNFIYQMSWTDHGFTMVYHDNVHQVKGTGVTTGETFTASGGTNGITVGSWVDDHWVGMLTRQMRINGQNTSFTVTYKYHITITSDGTVTIDSREQTAECN